MADVVHVRTKKRDVIEFHTGEGLSLIEIHRPMRSLYGEDSIEISSVGR